LEAVLGWERMGRGTQLAEGQRQSRKGKKKVIPYQLNNKKINPKLLMDYLPFWYWRD